MNSGSHDVIAPFEWKPSSALRPAVLEDEHQQPVGGGDRQQVQQHRLDRDHERAERDQQQQEAQRQDEREDHRRVALHLLVEVVRAGRLAGHRRLRRRAARRPWPGSRRRAASRARRPTCRRCRRRPARATPSRPCGPGSPASRPARTSARSRARAASARRSPPARAARVTSSAAITTFAGVCAPGKARWIWS